MKEYSVAIVYSRQDLSKVRHTLILQKITADTPQEAFGLAVERTSEEFSNHSIYLHSTILI